MVSSEEHIVGYRSGGYIDHRETQSCGVIHIRLPCKAVMLCGNAVVPFDYQIGTVENGASNEFEKHCALELNIGLESSVYNTVSAVSQFRNVDLNFYFRSLPIGAYVVQLFWQLGIGDDPYRGKSKLEVSVPWDPKSTSSVETVQLHEAVRVHFHVGEQLASAQVFPNCRGRLWGNYGLWRQIFASALVNPVGNTNSLLPEAVVLNISSGVILVEWSSLPVFYDITIWRKTMSVKIRVKTTSSDETNKYQPKSLKSSLDSLIDDLEELDETITYALKFKAYGEYGVEIFASSQKKGKTRIYHQIGQFLLQVYPPTRQMDHQGKLVSYPVIETFTWKPQVTNK